MSRASPLDPAFPAGPRATLDSALLRAFVAPYDLAPIGAITDLGGTYNLNLRIETARGAVVGRVYRPWMTVERLRQIGTVRSALLDAGISTPVPIATRYGSPLGRYGDRLAEIEPFVAETRGVRTWAERIAAARLLAQLHDRLEARLDSPARVPPPISNDAPIATLLRWTRHARHRLAPGDERARAIADRTLMLLHTLSRLDPDSDDRLPLRWTHGDFGGDNVRLRDGRIAALLDLDFLDRRARIFDIAYFGYWSLRSDNPGSSPAAWNWRAYAALLAAYDSAAADPLAPIERDRLIIRMARVPLYWIAEAALLPDPATRLQTLARNVMHAAELVDHSRLIDNLNSH